MKLASILLVSTLALLAMPAAGAGQEPGKTPRIGYVRSGSPATDPYRDSLLRGLRDLGYVDGRSIAIEFRYYGDDAAATTQLMNDLVRSKVDVIVAGGTHAIRAAQRATETIPIVMLAADPQRSGFVAGLARPGGNITGVAVLSTELVGKRLQLLKEAMPGAIRVALLQHPDNPSHSSILKELGADAQSLGLTLRAFEVSRSEDFQSAFGAMAEWPADVAVALDDSTFIANRVPLANTAARQSLPLVCGFREMTEAGCLMSYAVDLREMYYRMAKYVDKIIKGAKPAELPVEQPMQFELVINLKAAKALGVTIPPTLLARAEEVIE